MTLAALGGSLAADALLSVRAGVSPETAERLYARRLARASRPHRRLTALLCFAARSPRRQRALAALLRRSRRSLERLVAPLAVPLAISPTTR